MTTRLQGRLRREIDIGRVPYTLTLDPEGLHLARKGRRKGRELRWADLVSGEAALAAALNASLTGRPGMAGGKKQRRAKQPASPSAAS